MHEPQATTLHPPQEQPAAEPAGLTGPAAPPASAQAPGHRPLGVGVQLTGHPGVDAQLRRLADADHLDVAAHLEVYEDVHRALRDTLTALDQRSGSIPAPGPAPRS